MDVWKCDIVLGATPSQMSQVLGQVGKKGSIYKCPVFILFAATDPKET